MSDIDRPGTEILNDPCALATFQQQNLTSPRLKALSTYVKLPPLVKRKIYALKNLQYDMFKLEGAFFKRLNDLEREFERLYAPLYDKRRDIVNGDLDPADTECEWPFEESIDLSSIIFQEPTTSGDVNNYGMDILSDKVGVPEFWLTIFRNVPLLRDSKEDADDPILRKLYDIKYTINGAEKRPGFCLEFFFAPNDYFNNSVLTKEYFVRFDPVSSDPLSYQGTEIIQAKGCIISWKPGKNVTIKTIKKNIKNKNRGEKKTVTKTVKTSSFFNFFSPPTISLEDVLQEELEEEVEEELQSDFELGHYFRETVIPRAVLLYTGEGLVDEEEEEEDFESGEDNEDDCCSRMTEVRSNI